MYKTVKLVGLFVQWIDEYSSLHAFLLVAFIGGRGGQYKRPFGNVPPT